MAAIVVLKELHIFAKHNFWAREGATEKVAKYDVFKLKMWIKFVFPFTDTIYNIWKC